MAAATDIWLCEIARRWLGSRYVSTAVCVCFVLLNYVLRVSMAAVPLVDLFLPRAFSVALSIKLFRNIVDDTRFRILPMGCEFQHELTVDL